MIEEPSINAVYRVVRPQSTYLLERQSKLAPKYLTSQVFAEMYNRQVDLFADEFNYLLPEERLVFPAEDDSTIEGYYWRYLPVNERECYFKGMSRWSMMIGGYIDGRLHKFLLLEASSGQYYWGRVNRGVFSRISRLRVNEKKDLKNLSVAFAQVPNNNELPEEFAAQISFWISSGSPLLDLIDCAAGRLDMFAASATSEILPVILTVMQESGGLVCDLNGDILGSNFDIRRGMGRDGHEHLDDHDHEYMDDHNPERMDDHDHEYMDDHNPEHMDEHNHEHMDAQDEDPKGPLARDEHMDSAARPEGLALDDSAKAEVGMEATEASEQPDHPEPPEPFMVIAGNPWLIHAYRDLINPKED